MSEHASRCQLFGDLHFGDQPLLLPNPWDVGSAKLLASLGFQALATTSAGHAASLGRLDGQVTRDEAIEHAAAIVGATELPVSADFENGFATEPQAVAANIGLAAATGLAGLSVEDYSGDDDDPIYDMALARARVEAAAEAAHGGAARLVLTARSENYLHGRPDIADTIARLQAYQEAGADVLYAPWLVEPTEIKAVCDSVDLPVNVLARPGGPTVVELAALGVARVSVGGAFALAGLAALNRAASEFLDKGTYGFFGEVAEGVAVRDSAFGA
ncbi:MAG: isocitrate lyase/phosphoenolpyruvate mutase family protein [Acidimicrobiia bacterium]|nr:isocitrate lyase/phosphoenolpyruvate mutase family protein [Acidimicrobiia bacterium]